jgi:hypothetical protein
MKFNGVDGVQLKITSSLSGNENLDPGKALYLNINPDKYNLLGSLGFSKSAIVKQAQDKYKADGIGGCFDILFTYSKSTKAFMNGQSQTYFISSSIGTVSASDLAAFLSKNNNGSPLLAAVHVQGVTTTQCVGDSGWVHSTTSVPDGGTTVILLGFAITGIGTLRGFTKKL